MTRRCRPVCRRPTRLRTTRCRLAGVGGQTAEVDRLIGAECRAGVGLVDADVRRVRDDVDRDRSDDAHAAVRIGDGRGDVMRSDAQVRGRGDRAAGDPLAVLVVVPAHAAATVDRDAVAVDRAVVEQVVGLGGQGHRRQPRKRVVVVRKHELGARARTGRRPTCATSPVPGARSTASFGISPAASCAPSRDRRSPSPMLPQGRTVPTNAIATDGTRHVGASRL